MDPFVVVAFSKKVFRTRVIRHSRTPTWDEKLLFHVRQHETNFKIKFSVLDWDKLSGNDHIGDVTLDLAELMKDLPMRDPNTGLYPSTTEPANNTDLKEYTLDLIPGKEASWEGKHKPVITIRCVSVLYIRNVFILNCLYGHIGRNINPTMLSANDSGSNISSNTILITQASSRISNLRLCSIRSDLHSRPKLSTAFSHGSTRIPTPKNSHSKKPYNVSKKSSSSPARRGES